MYIYIYIYIYDNDLILSYCVQFNNSVYRMLTMFTATRTDSTWTSNELAFYHRLELICDHFKFRLLIDSDL